MKELGYRTVLAGRFDNAIDEARARSSRFGPSSGPQFKRDGRARGADGPLKVRSERRSDRMVLEVGDGRRLRGARDRGDQTHPSASASASSPLPVFAERREDVPS